MVRMTLWTYTTLTDSASRRVSTDRQAENGYGLAAQEKAIRAFLRELRTRPRHLYVDRGVSGAVEHRPALAELLADVQPGDIVLVARLDRLARDLLVQEVLLRDIRERGAEVMSCSPSEAEFLQDDPHDPTRRLVRQVLGAISEFERALIRLRLQRGRAIKAEQGGFAYGSPPYGFRADGGELVLDAVEQDAIRMAVNLRNEGHSLREVGLALADAGYPSKRGGGWHPTTVARLLSRASQGGVTTPPLRYEGP
jgi:DNA invertase Pin-like site-specific DNA recombinase